MDKEYLDYIKTETGADSYFWSKGGYVFVFGSDHVLVRNAYCNNDRWYRHIINQINNLRA